MIRKSIILLLTGFAFLVSCKKENRFDCLKGTGKTITEVRDITGVEEIVLSDKINLNIIQDTIEWVEITAGEKLMPLIRTEKMGRKLYIRNDNRCNWVRSFKNSVDVNIHLKMLKSLESSGSGDVTSKNILTSDTISVNLNNASGIVRLSMNVNIAHLNIHTGVADLIVSGKAGMCYMWSAGNGLFQCSDLESDIVFITSKSSNQCYINVKAILGATILTAGNIFYKGSPHNIQKYCEGSGDLIRLD